jgi:hypothetical protein
MTAREKFQSVMRFTPGAPCPKAEFGYWAGAVRRWLREGLPLTEEVPADALDGDLVRGSVPFGFESRLISKAGTTELVDRNVMPVLGLESHLAKFPIDFSPRLPRRVIQDDDRRRLFTDSYGITKMVMKENAATWHSVDFPIKSRRDLKDYIARYDTDYASRLPAGGEELAAALADRDYPIRLGGEPFGFTYFPRSLMGDVGYMTALYDEPGLIHEMCEFLLSFTMGYWGLILGKVRVDCVVILEDVAYRNGPMISRTMFQEFAAPYTRRLVDFVRGRGVECVLVDCDGKIDELVPVWADAGVTGLFPVEAVNDVVALGRAYPGLQIVGGVDKRPLIAGDRAGIDAELDRVSPLIPRGGFIPHIDHAVPEDISWECFSYYRSHLNALIDSAAH